VSEDKLPQAQQQAMSLALENDTGAAVGLLGVVLSQMDLLEKRIGARIDASSESGRGRWEKHEREHREQADAIELLMRRLDTHLEAEAREALVLQARLGPIRSGASWIYREWRTLLLLAVVLVDILGHLLHFE
jgi:hypothetical protein